MVFLCRQVKLNLIPLYIAKCHCHVHESYNVIFFSIGFLVSACNYACTILGRMCWPVIMWWRFSMWDCYPTFGEVHRTAKERCKASFQYNSVYIYIYIQWCRLILKFVISYFSAVQSWNSLPFIIHHSPSLPASKADLKTHLFRQYLFSVLLIMVSVCVYVCQWIWDGWVGM